MVGLTDAESSEAIPSRFTGPHRGSREWPGMPILRAGGESSPLNAVHLSRKPGADSIGSPPGRGTRRRGGRSRGGGSLPLITRGRVDGRVSGPINDTHRNSLARTSVSPEGSSQIIALIGTGVNQVGRAALDGPPRAKAGTITVILPARVARSHRVLSRDRTAARGLTVDPKAINGRIAAHASGESGASAAAAATSGLGRRGRRVRPARTQLTLALQPSRTRPGVRWTAQGRLAGGTLDRPPHEASSGRGARDASKE